MSFSLQFDSGEPFDVFEHTDTGTLCRMSVSHFNAERLRMFIKRTGVLVNDRGHRIHGVRLLTSTPDSKFGPLAPNEPGGGEATGEMVL